MLYYMLLWPTQQTQLSLPVSISVSKNLMKGRNLDIHESDLKYQGKVLEVYDDICRKKNYWVKVNCTKNGRILPSSEIHKKVLQILKEKKIIN